MLTVAAAIFIVPPEWLLSSLRMEAFFSIDQPAPGVNLQLQQTQRRDVQPAANLTNSGAAPIGVRENNPIAACAST
jgi:hypothetical protein